MTLIITHFIAACAGAGLACLGWSIFARRIDHTIEELRGRAADDFVAMLQMRRTIRDLEAFKAKYDQPRVGGRFAAKVR